MERNQHYSQPSGVDMSSHFRLFVLLGSEATKGPYINPNGGKMGMWWLKPWWTQSNSKISDFWRHPHTWTCVILRIYIFELYIHHTYILIGFPGLSRLSVHACPTCCRCCSLSRLQLDNNSNICLNSLRGRLRIMQEISLYTICQLCL